MKTLDTAQTAELLLQKDDFVILTHRNPDGDTLGSAFALLRALRSIGKRAFVSCSDEIPEKFSYLYADLKNEPFEPQFVVAVDVADVKLLGSPNAELYGERVDLCIDHHMSHRAYAEYLHLQDVAATAQIFCDLIPAMGAQIDEKTASCIYTGLSTDTGCFRYSNTAPSTLRAAADMIECGADHEFINRVMFETESLSYLALQKAALESLETYFDGKCAVITLTQAMFCESGSDESACDGIASIPRRIEGAQAGVTIRERKDGTYKVSLRTHAPIDAAEICKKLGGGGHARAAGCEFDGPLADGKARLLKEIESELKK